MDMARKLITILGTTGAGKTKLSIEIAKAIGGEVINADAMQMYRGLDVATAKVTEEEMEGVPHHLLSVLSPLDQCDVVEFNKMAIDKIEDVLSRGKIPVLVGGTMFYVQSVLWESQLLDDSVLSQKPICESNDTTKAYESLKLVDPEMANRLHPNDVRRVLRSLEIYEQTGKPHSTLLRQQQDHNHLKTRYDTCAMWVDCEREVLHSRLNERVNKMIKSGLMNEIQGLRMSLNVAPKDLSKGKSYGILQAIGFKEFSPYFEAIEAKEEKFSIDACLSQSIEDLKSATRQYARRQLTWIRNRILRRNIPVFKFDTTDIKSWNEKVSNPAILIAKLFLETSNLELMKSQLNAEPANITNDHKQKPQWKKYICEACDGRVFNGEHEWNIHLSTKKHRRNTNRKNREQ